MGRVTPHGSRRHFRTVWISDVHLGFKGCQAECLLEFLRSFRCDTLYLVGDIVDAWQLKRKPYWPQEHNDVVRTILGKAKHGTRVIYVPGNHDELLKNYSGHAFGNVSIINKTIHERANGERLLVLHGDQFDAAVESSRWIGVLGGWAYEVLLDFNIVVNRVRTAFGYKRWSLAAFLKHKVKNAVQYISRFEQVVAEEAARAGVEGVVCGHIHRAEIVRLGDIEYHNCGDWVESCTALVEHRDGRIELLDMGSSEPATVAEPAVAA